MLVDVVLGVEEELSLDAPNLERPAATEPEVARRDEEVTVRGAAGVGAANATPGDGVRPITGGVCTGEGVPDGLGVDGLLQDSKKSSSSGRVAADGDASTPSTAIPFGNLGGRGQSSRR